MVVVQKSSDEKVFAKNLYLVEPARAFQGDYPAWDFFLSLSPLEQAKLQQLFDYIAATGKIRNPERFKKVEDRSDLFEFKNHQIRMPCFWEHGKRLVVTHGFMKKQDRTPVAEIKRAIEIRDAHRAFVKGGK